MKFSKKIARQIAFPLITNLGIEKVLSRTSNNSLLNIYYHGVVLDDSNFFSPRHLHIKQFEKQIKYLKQNFDIITLDEAFEVKKQNLILKKPTITISFDDGYKNNIRNALPILEKYKVKTTFFISGICSENDDKNLLWTDVLAFAKFFCKEKTIQLKGETYVNFIEVESKLSIKDFLKGKPLKYRDEVINELVVLCDINNRKSELSSDIWQLMNSDDVRFASESDIISIGTHGYNHYNLGLIDISDAMNDIHKSKDVLESIVDKEVDMICYPDGSYSLDVVGKCNDLGLTKHVCCDYLNREHYKRTDMLNRYGIANTTTYASNIFFINRNFTKKGL